LSYWFTNCNRGVLELGWPDECGKITRFRRFELDDLVAATRFATETNSRPGCSLYFRPATVRPEPQYTRDTDVVQIPGCWCDCDEPDAIDRLLATAPTPTFQIVTGRHPELRCQFLWKLADDPLLVPEWARQLNLGIHALAGSDPAVANPSTLLRLPGTVAWPLKPGRIPELTEWIIPTGGGHSISYATLKAQLPEIAPEQTRSNGGTGPTTTTEILNPVQVLIDRAVAGPKWHDPVLRLVAMLVHRGVPSSVILAMAEHLTWPNYSITQTREELAVMIAGAIRKGFDGGEDQEDEETEESIVDDVMKIPPKAVATFPLLTIDDLLALPDPTWLIPDLLETNTLAVLYGQWGSFKSFAALNLALHLATGMTWCDRPLEQCNALYIAGEGSAGLKLRIDAWLQHHNLTERPRGFRTIPLAINLMQPAATQQLIDTVNAHNDFSPRLVIVDTLHRSMPGGDENSAKDMGVIINHVALAQRELGCTCLLVHHPGKEEDRGLRGSSGLPGAADTIIHAVRGGPAVTLQVKKQKNAEDGQRFFLQTQVVALPSAGIKPRSSLVLVPCDHDPGSSRPQLTDRERRAVEFLTDLIASEGQPLPQGGGYPSPIHGQPLRGVKKVRWQEECEARQLSTADEKFRRTEAFKRVFQSLLNKSVVVVRDDSVWLA
jgi:AAA domain